MRAQLAGDYPLNEKVGIVYGAGGWLCPAAFSVGRVVHKAGFVLMISPQSALKTSKFKEFWRFFVKNYDCAVGAEKEACFWNKVEFEF